jgi:hypothetical protein
MIVIALDASVKVNRMFQWLWNTKEEVRASTWCRVGSNKGNADGCYENNLAHASTTSFGMVSLFATHEKGGQHGYEQDSIVVPECICSEDEKTWMNQ